MQDARIRRNRRKETGCILPLRSQTRSVMRALATATDAPFLLIDRLTKLWIILCDFYDVNVRCSFVETVSNVLTPDPKS